MPPRASRLGSPAIASGATGVYVGNIHLAAAEYKVKVEGENAKSQFARAEGEAESQVIIGEGRAKAYKMLVETLGRDQVAQLELLKHVVEGKVQITPQVMVSGANGAGTMDALADTILRQSVAPAPAPAKQPSPFQPENLTMRLLLFVSAFGILISFAVLIMVIMKAKKDSIPPKMKPSKDD